MILIDAGAGMQVEDLLRNLQADFPTVPLTAVLVTHCHLDHCGGAAALKEKTGCILVAPECSRRILESGDEEASGLRVAREQGIYPPDFQLAPCPVDITVRDGQTFSVDGTEFTALQVRGHSEDSFCFVVEIDGQKCLFSGDAVFYGGVLGVINAEGSGMEGYRRDLHKLKGLEIQGLFPGHGLFTLRDGQKHLDCALQQTGKGFLARQIGQGELLF
ncbi:MAG: MBL fold metallo-hydrolase [Acidobacteria bacterium]|jgi:glyoxylase-like metal-dependent hydrolase (beta-lactamase superfamily II)|nr:MBL fold metallo-hydrolase [Acidobacteriota bacterium]